MLQHEYCYWTLCHDNRRDLDTFSELIESRLKLSWPSRSLLSAIWCCPDGHMTADLGDHVIADRRIVSCDNVRMHSQGRSHRGAGGQSDPPKKKKISHKNRKNGKKKGKLGRKWKACRELAPADGKGWLRPCAQQLSQDKLGCLQ